MWFKNFNTKPNAYQIYQLAQLKAGNNSEKLKNEIRQLFYSLYRFDPHFLNMETIFMNSKYSKTNEFNKFIYQFTGKLNLKNPSKIIQLVNLSIYYTWKNIKSAYNNNKCKISAPTWNDQSDLPNGLYSISDIQDCFEYIIKKHEAIADNPPVQIYVNKIKNRINFKIKAGYKTELFSAETMKLLGSSKKDFDKDKS